jgi:hypothetical protein
MFVRYLFLLLTILAGCSLLEKPKGISAEERFDRERMKVVHGALKKFIKSMEAKGYRAAGIGEGLDHSHGTEKEKQNYLGVTFDIERLPNVDFARKIEVEALQEFLCYINSEEGIQDYVAEYPYPLKFIRIAFINRHPETGLFSVANCQEEIYYTQDEPDKPMGPSREIHSESYEDAVRMVEQQPSS